MSDFRKPRADTPILPQNAVFRTEPVKPFKRPKGRRGRKPRGKRLISFAEKARRTGQQFNRFHTEAARNKERDRAEQQRIDKIKERDDARRERTERLQIEDRRYAVKVFTDERERRAERGFRDAQLRLLRQQAAAAAAPPAPPAINIAPAPVNIAPARIDVAAPVINIPAQPPPQVIFQPPAPAARLPSPPRVVRDAGGGGGAPPRGFGGGQEVPMSAAEQQEAREAIYRGLVGGAQREQERANAAFREEIQGDIRRGIREAAGQLGVNLPSPVPERGAPVAIQLPDRGVDAERFAAQQVELAAQARRAEELEERLAAEQQQARRQLDEAGLAAAQQQRDLLQQTQQRIAQAEAAGEERIRAAQAQAARQLEEAAGARGEGEQELTRQIQRRASEAARLRTENEALSAQRDAAAAQAAAAQSEAAQRLSQEDVDAQVRERLADQYRQLVRNQASAEELRRAGFDSKLEQFAQRVIQTGRYPEHRSGSPISPNSRVFYIGALNRAEAAQQARRIESAREQAFQEGLAAGGSPSPQPLVRRGSATPSAAGEEPQFSFEESALQSPREPIRVGAPELTDSQIDRDFDALEDESRVDYSLNLPFESGSPDDDTVQPPRSRVQERREERRAGGRPLPSDEITLRPDSPLAPAALLLRERERQQSESPPPRSAIPTSDPEQRPRTFARLEPEPEVEPDDPAELLRRAAEAQSPVSEAVDRSLEADRPFELEGEDGFYREIPEGGGAQPGGIYRINHRGTGKNYERVWREEEFGWATPFMNGKFDAKELYKPGLKVEGTRGGQPASGYHKDVWGRQQEGEIPFELVIKEPLDQRWATGKKAANIPTQPGSYKFRAHGKRGVAGNAGKFNFFHERGDIGQHGIREGKGKEPDFQIDLHKHAARMEDLAQRGSIEFRQVQPPEEPGVLRQAGAAAGGAVAAAGGVMGNAALGAARGVAGGVYDRLPSAGDVGEAVGRGAVAAASGVAGVVRGGINQALSPAEPPAGEQTGGVAQGLTDSDLEL